MINFILYTVAYTLGIIIIPIGMLYALFKRDLSSYFFKLALSLDQLGNIAMGRLFNDILIKPNRDLFGNEDETISSVLGKNQVNGTLRPLGKFLVDVLDKFEKNHSIKSIEKDV
jgi:hypothetical protein